jgi:hypothetical protein
LLLGIIYCCQSGWPLLIVGRRSADSPTRLAENLQVLGHCQSCQQCLIENKTSDIELDIDIYEGNVLLTTVYNCLDKWSEASIYADADRATKGQGKRRIPYPPLPVCSFISSVCSNQKRCCTAALHNLDVSFRERTSLKEFS